MIQLPRTRKSPAPQNKTRIMTRQATKKQKQKLIINPVLGSTKPSPAQLVMYKFYANLGDNDATVNSKQNGLCKCVKYEVRDSKKGIADKDIELLKCNNPVVKGTDFCKDHQNCMGFLRKYTSGFEPKYAPNAWSHPYVEGSHNCYAYFLDDKKASISAKCEEFCLKKNKKGCPLKDDDCQDLIPQPGDYFLLNNNGNTKGTIGLEEKKDRKYTCPNMMNKILADNPEIKPSHLLEKCPANHYKGAMVVDTGNTFHFYRQNPDATWSHKPGILPVTNLDASGKKIYIPHFANRNYGKDRNNSPIIYNDFCGYYCIPSNKYYETNLS